MPRENFQQLLGEKPAFFAEELSLNEVFTCQPEQAFLYSTSTAGYLASVEEAASKRLGDKIEKPLHEVWSYMLVGDDLWELDVVPATNPAYVPWGFRVYPLLCTPISEENSVVAGWGKENFAFSLNNQIFRLSYHYFEQEPRAISSLIRASLPVVDLKNKTIIHPVYFYPQAFGVGLGEEFINAIDGTRLSIRRAREEKPMAFLDSSNWDNLDPLNKAVLYSVLDHYSSLRLAYGRPGQTYKLGAETPTYPDFISQASEGLLAQLALQIESFLHQIEPLSLRQYFLDILWHRLSLLNFSFPENSLGMIDRPEGWENWPEGRRTKFLADLLNLTNLDNWHTVTGQAVITSPFVSELPRTLQLEKDKEPLSLFWGHIYMPQSLFKDPKVAEQIYDAMGPKNYRVLSEGFPRRVIFSCLATGIKDLLGDKSILQELTFLDAGCGPEELMKEALERVFNNPIVYGVDVSKRMVGAAVKKGIIARKGDMQKTVPFEKKFDVVIASYVFHYFRDSEMALGNICNSLKPNGILAVALRRQEIGWEKIWSSRLKQAGFQAEPVFEEREVSTEIGSFQQPIKVGLIFTVKNQ
jgi:SAM-dependent methyltransferase